MIFPKHGLIRWIGDNKRGLQAVFGGFLIQLCAGVNYIIIYISRVKKSTRSHIIKCHKKVYGAI